MAESSITQDPIEEIRKRFKDTGILTMTNIQTLLAKVDELEKAQLCARCLRHIKKGRD